MFAVVLALALMVIAGLVVDGSAQLKAKQKANMVASEACRSGAQAISADAVTGGVPEVDVGQAQEAAQAYIDLTASSSQTITGTARVDGTTLECQTSVTFDTIFLGMIGYGELTVHGRSTVDAVRVLEGVPQ